MQLLSRVLLQLTFSRISLWFYPSKQLSFQSHSSQRTQYKKIISNLVQTPSCLWLHVHWDWRSLVGQFAPPPPSPLPSLMPLNFWICQLFHTLCVTSPTFCYRWKLQSVWICFQEFWKVSLCPGFKTFLPVHARFFGNINKGFPLSPSSGGDLRWLIKTAPEGEFKWRARAIGWIRVTGSRGERQSLKISPSSKV